MTRIRIITEQPNAVLLVAELRKLPEFELANLQQTTVEADDGSLANADFVSIVIDIAVGMISAGAYDLVKSAITNARRRGHVTYSIEEDESGQTDDNKEVDEPDEPDEPAA